jgi:oxygen-independent coproporphyrinogen-3 oxidase
MTTHSQLKLFGLFDAQVPRYTSYPTAPQFAGGVTAETHAGWLRSLPAGSEISLYLHVPFCRRLCWFCACRTQGTSSDAPVAAYVQVLKEELALLKRHLAPGIGLSRLHWGGGTPTLLNAEMIAGLTAAIFDVVPLAPGAEFSVEIDPNEIDEARLDALVAAGLSRASIGVQDFDPLIQKTIGRIQPYELTAKVAAMIRARGISSLNADILYGLPHQTPARITASVAKLLALAPDRVALYGYAHVPWMSRRQQMIPSDALPTPHERLDLFELARQMFLGAGYDEIGIDHFARPEDGLAQAARQGRLRRNFQGYTDDPAEVLVGLGASSISRFPQGYSQNASGTADHGKAIREGHFSTHRGHVFQGEDLWRGRIIEALLCDFRVSRAEVEGRFGADPARLEALFAAAAAQFPGMVEVTAEGFALMPAARPLARMIARSFDAYDKGTARHSAAI